MRDVRDVLRWLARTLLFAYVVARPTLASAQLTGTRVTVEFEAPAQCSSAKAFWEALHARSRRLVPAENGPRDVVVHVEITRETTSVLGRLQLWLGGAVTEPRVVRASGCDELTEALALTAALSIDPDASTTRSTDSTADAPSENGSSPASNPNSTASSSPAEGAKSAKPPANSENKSPQTERAVETPRPIEPWRPSRSSPWTPSWSLSAAASAALPIDATAAVGGRGLVGLSSGRSTGVRIELGLGFLSSAPLDDQLAMKYELLFGELNACLGQRPSSGWVAIGCASLELGQLYAAGQNLELPEVSRRLWVAPGIQLRAEYPASDHITAGVEFSAHLPATPQTYSVGTPSAQVARTPVLIPGAAVRIQWLD